MPLSIILLCLPAPPPQTAFVRWSRQRPQHPGMIRQHPTRMWCFLHRAWQHCSHIILRLGLNYQFYQSWPRKTFRVNGHKWRVQLRTAPWQQRHFWVATETSLCSSARTQTHTLSLTRTHTHTHTHTHWGALRWSFLCMKMEIMTKNITKNTTTSK